jgi:hypothetical protein
MTEEQPKPAESKPSTRASTKAVPEFQSALEANTAWNEIVRGLETPPDWREDGVRFEGVDDAAATSLRLIAGAVLPNLGYQTQFGRTRDSFSIGVQQG